MDEIPQLHTNEQYNNIKSTFIDIFTFYQSNLCFDKTELINILPSYLKKQNTTKEKIIAKWSDEVSEEDFIELLMEQNEGIEYPTFEYFILKYDLEFDDNHMIIFTDEFPFSSKIKKEALFIFSILRALLQHELIGEFLNLYDFQMVFETDNIEDKRKKKYDIAFVNLHFAIEIDENHTGKKVIANDKLKDIISAMNGVVLLRMDFQKIYKDERTSKGKREIPKNENANKYMLNSEYYSEFIENLYTKLTNALLNRDKNFRSMFLMHLFKESLTQKKQIIKKDNKSIYAKLKKNTKKKNSIKHNDMFIKEIYNINKKSIKKIDSYIEFIQNDDGFLQLFKIKDSYKSNIIGEKNIPLCEVIEVLKLSDNTVDINLLIKFLRDNFIISALYDFTNEIKISWKDLGHIISEYYDKSTIGHILRLYYRELEESYEYIIERMNAHIKDLTPNGDKYEICMNNEVKKAIIPLNKTIDVLESDKLDLSDTLKDLKVKFKKLINRLRKINLSYNSLFDGERNHQQSFVNKRFNEVRSRGYNMFSYYSSESESDYEPSDGAAS